MDELKDAFKNMSNLRCADNDGLVVGMIKYGSLSLHERICEAFNSILHTGQIFEDWHNTIFQMLPKHGDGTQPGNWRPIAILPILYKLFAKLLYQRLSPLLFQHQSFDQNVFVLGRRIEDGLFCIEIMTEYALEFNVPLWILNMDLKKAFDTINHQALFAGLRHHDIPEEYIHLIILLYSNQIGTVYDSDLFGIKRGVKQGDCLSAIFFNCILDIVFDRWKETLKTEGIMIENFLCRLTNTRYADDILLYVKNLEELVFMIENLTKELRKVGLVLNTDKTNILHTPLEDDENTKLDYVEIDGGLVQILHPEESHRYLGRLISMSADGRGNIEFNNRRRQAWAAFHKHKRILLNQNVSLKKRLDFFVCCVNPAMLFGLITLPMTKIML